MRFAHIADCHIGGWREPHMRNLGVKAFSKAVNICIERHVDFVLLSGDLFNTSVPSIDFLKEVVRKLRFLRKRRIEVYAIAGSHDFSPSGKTILEVLEKAGLVRNVVKAEIIDGKIWLKFTVDKKTGAKITGLLGRKGQLEKDYYKELDRHALESEPGFKVFMFHSAITEYKSEEHMDSMPLSFLPEGFDYYAGGHVHEVFQHKVGKGIIAMPGPLFPNNFRELELLRCGGFFIYDDGKVEHVLVQTCNVFPLLVKCQNRTPEEVKELVLEEIKPQEFANTIVTLRMEGTMLSGKLKDIDFRGIISAIYDKGAFFVMRNTTKLLTKEYENIDISSGSTEEVEQRMISEQIGNAIGDEKYMLQLMDALDKERMEDERVSEFELRLKESTRAFFKDVF